MNTEKQLYTISVYTENNIGLLNRISAIFQRRHINIESLNISPSEIEGVAKFTIVVNMTEVDVKKIIGQIEKQVEVIKAYFHNFEERQIQNIIKESNARIVTVNKEFFVLEKSGKKEEIAELYNQLSLYGIMQYTRSGLIAVTKEEMKISALLETYNN
jgi:acetolactate synthase-1/3 small subunit